MKMGTVITGLILLFMIQTACYGLPLKGPSFVSQWYSITSDPNGRNQLDIEHNLGEIPVYVQVQVKSISEPNKDFIFPAMGHVLRDDDDDKAPYSGLVYLYNDVKVVVSAPVENNNYRGRTIYTENSNYWEGPNRQDVYVAWVRVRAWKLSSFPKPDFHSSGNGINSNCDNNGGTCFYEIQHNLDEFPSFAVIRTQLKAGTSDLYNNYMADAIGAGHIIYENIEHESNGYVIYGFDKSVFRIWTDSSTAGRIFDNDGYTYGTITNEGELEIMAWSFQSLQEDFEHNIELGAIPGTYFEMETNYQLNTEPDTDSIVGFVWVEAHDGRNAGFRFPGTGSMSYATVKTANPCCYGGLAYAYTNTTVRLWKPGSVSYGKLVCIPDIFANGKYSQGSNNGSAVMKIWTVSNAGESCDDRNDCLLEHSDCINSTCRCQHGYYESMSQCKKELACSDTIPYLPELARRQRNNLINNQTTQQKPLDDSYLGEAWYRTNDSNGQYIMPDMDTVPMAGSCGTMYPTYIKGQHPPIENITEEGTEVFVAVLNKDETTSYSIHVRKCGTSVQYRLHPITKGEFGFCFDNPSIQGQSEFVEAPSHVRVEDLYVKADLEYYYVDDHAGDPYYKPSLVFDCVSNELNNLPKKVFFTTYWFINGNLFEAYGPSENITRLTEDTLTERNMSLGIDILCGIQLSASTSGYKTELVRSKAFFAGIKILDTVVILRKGATATVRLKPTVPIGCSYRNPNTDCTNKNVYMKPINKDVCEVSDLVVVQSRPKCGIQLKTFRKDEKLESSTNKFRITTEDINYNDRYFFRLQLITDSVGHKIWRSYQLQDVKVHITHNDDTKYKLCYARVDPHMKTADDYTYEHQYDGEFIFYRNFEYDIEVQMKTTSCNRGYAFCACAVAIRAGGDVFLINLCGKSKFIGYTSCTDNGILVVDRKDERRYLVYTPIGTYIDLTIRPHPNYHNLMNVHLYMAPKDFGATEGLCGYHDNKKTNDLRKRQSSDFYPIDPSNGRHYHEHFSEEWRIQNYEANYLRVNIDPIPRWSHNLFCFCNISTQSEQVPETVCSASVDIRCPISDGGNEVPCFTYENGNKNERQRRSNLDSFADIDRDVPTRVKRDISEGEAEAICRQTILGHPAVTEFTHRLISVDLEDSIRECTFDVSVQGDDSWANIYPDVLIEIIETFNKKDPKYVKEHGEEMVKFKSMSCPRNCSGNGECNKNGVCVCKDGYLGSDCSIDRSKPLTIDDIYGDGLCDISDHNTCDCFTVQTIDLLEDFFCNITMTTIMVNGSEENEQYSIQGTYTNMFNGICCVRKGNRHKRSTIEEDVFSVQYGIALSNDGNNFGDFRTMLVYDSRCQEVTMNGTRVVHLKTHMCYIRGLCVPGNETAVYDDCLYCSPEDGQFVWTSKCEDLSDLPLMVIAIASASCLIVLLGMGVFLWRVCKPSKKVSDVAIFNAVVLKPVQDNLKRTSRLTFGVHEDSIFETFSKCE